ncbi:hypothetical protein EK21DRAFT_54601 [Setomelanomma holmii]|uniref:Rhodopsin domain-containing protein n=1 Tax=Setomelanomma holmii TaxID=210430 RepID=A0A9P4HIA7_9PLEO|nr:hypothetical protein EK21DRAFT_54601 [Setomelanomma holmii]
MATYEEMLLAMLANPPDPNEPLPVANRRETIYGLTISFLILSWFAVLFRLWVRVRIVRDPGWDDMFVLLAAVSNTAATACVCLSVEHGLGRHMLYLPLPEMEKYLMFFYLEHSMYLTETAFIKISLLLQFLRIFKAGAVRWTCLTLLVLVSLWGLSFFIVGWFPCFPIRGAWNRNIGAKCYGFGLGDVQNFIIMFKIHSASNMTFDLAIFLTPLILFGKPNLKPRNLVAMAGVFAFGALVVSASIWRLYQISVTQAATYPYIDFTWWSPMMIILSCLEIDLAIICASMPIFWPIIEKSFAAIFVSYEVNVTEERVSDDYGLAYELEHTKSGRKGSMRSTSGTSVEALTREDESMNMPKYSIGVDPLSEEARIGGGFQATIETRPKLKWEL